jgi:hypothetical protein
MLIGTLLVGEAVPEILISKPLHGLAELLEGASRADSRARCPRGGAAADLTTVRARREVATARNARYTRVYGRQVITRV